MNPKETYNICDSLPEVVQKNKTNVIDLYDIIGNFTGNFVNGKYYNHRDIVVYNGSQYYCIAEGFTASKTPDTDTDNWTLYLAKGQTGSVGATGEKGEQGVSIVTVENKGTSQGEGYTITHCETVLSNGTRETFDVQAKDGAKGDKGDTGPQGPQGPKGDAGTIDPSSLRGAQIEMYNENQKVYFVDEVNQELIMMIFQNTDAQYVVELSSKNLSVKENSLQKAVTIYYDKIETFYDGSAKQFLHQGNVKTLFGNQSIYGSGNIDLYRHVLTFSNPGLSYVRMTFISSSNTPIDSLTDLFNLNLSADKIYPASGGTSYGGIGGAIVGAQCESSGGLIYITSGGSSGTLSWNSLSSLTITDTVTTV